MKTFKIGDRFIDDKGLVITVVNHDTNINRQILSFDKGDDVYVVNNLVTTAFASVVTDKYLNIKTFIIEDGCVYLTNDGDELEFKVIQDNPDDFAIYVSDEGTQYSSDGQYVVGGPESLKALNLAGLNNDHVKSVLNERKFKDTDFVDVKVSEMESIPPNSNPYLFDYVNSGLGLVHGWEAMFSSSQSSPLKELILVNTKSGQRLKLDLTKRQ